MAKKTRKRSKRTAPRAPKAAPAAPRVIIVKKKKTRKAAPAAPKTTRRKAGRRSGSSSMAGLVPSKEEMIDLATATGYGWAEQKALAEADFALNKVPRPVDQIGYTGNIALMSRLAYHFTRWAPFKHLARVTGHIATYHIGRNGGLFPDKTGAATPTPFTPSEPAKEARAAPAAATAPPAATSGVEGEDDDDLDVGALAADFGHDPDGAVPDVGPASALGADDDDDSDDD